MRHALSRTICQQYRDKDRVLRVVTLDPALEDILAAGVEYGERGMTIKLSPQVAESVTRGIAAQLEHLTGPGYPPVVLTTPQIRSALRQITAASLPTLAVMSLNEVTRDTHVESAGQVGIDVLSKDRRPVMAGSA